ncbi:MAG: hypothetical protein ACKO6R_09810 [Burkholderiaceae bacterium]
MSINGIGSAAAQVSAAPSVATTSTHAVAQANNAAIKTLYGSPGTVDGLANTLQRMKQLLQPAQAHIKSTYPETP